MKRLPLEKDIEAAFVEEMETWRHVYKNLPIVHWIERQVTMPYEGRADIVSVGPLVNYVVEVKRGRVDDKAVSQVIGYLEQLRTLVGYHARRRGYERLDMNGPIQGILVGQGLTKMAERAVNMSDLTFYRYSAKGGEIIFETDYGPYFIPQEEQLAGILGALVENAIESAIDTYQICTQLEGVELDPDDPYNQDLPY